MKMMVKLAAVMATLLLLSGVAFAQAYECDCYDITATKVDDPSVKENFFEVVCIDYAEVKGFTCGPAPNMVLSLFFDSMKDQGLGYTDNCWKYFKTHGDDHNVVTGISYCYGNRYTFWGHKTDIENCPFVCAVPI
jgi:hypothetical protein